MSTEITMQGSGTVGAVSSWSFTEAASPTIAGESNPNVGTLSIAAASTDESKFIVNNAVTITSDEIGEVEGTVSSVTVSGPSASLNVTSALQKFNADFTILPVTGGTMTQAADLLTQLSGTKYCTLNYASGRYWSLQGHSQGFQNDGSPVVYADNTAYKSSTYYSIPMADFLPYVAGSLEFDGGLFASGLFSFTRNRYFSSSSLLGNGIDLSVGRHPIVMYKFDPSVSSFVTLAGGPDDSNTSTGFNIQCGYSQPNDRLQITGYARIGGVNTAVSVLGSATGFSGSADVQLLVYARFTDAGTLAVDVDAVSTANYAIVRSISTTISTAIPDYFTPWSATGRVRAVFQCDELSDITATLISGDYEIANYGYTSTSASITNGAGSVIDGARMNGWEYLNQVATARRCEIALSGASTVLRGRGELSPVEIPSEEADSIEISSQATGLSVDVQYTGAARFSGTGAGPSDPMPPFSANVYPAQCVNLYDALTSGQTWSVNAGETVSVKVAVDQASAAFVANPRPSIYWNDAASFLAQKGVTEFGAYVVSGSDNLPIAPTQWIDYGGSVVARSTDDPSIVELTFNGPSEIPGATGPYKFSVSDGETDYPSLTIPGRGISLAPKTLNILTGAANTTVSVATSVSNVAIATAEQAHDAGSWAASKASGSWQGVRLNVPTVNLIAWNYIAPSALTKLGAFGFSAGSTFRIGEAILRIDSVNIGSVSSSIEASYYTTFGDLDSAWSAGTVGDFDSVWSSYDFGDIKIAPLRT